MRLQIQQYFDNGGTPATLSAELGIKFKPHPKYPELIHFSYDQLESPKDHHIVHECRGLILNSAQNWEVVAYPFRRFANYGETWAAPMDWSSIRVQEKIDGSLMILWWFEGTWNVSTKGSPDAGGEVGDWGFTFSQLFWRTMADRHTASMNVLELDITYMLELTSAYNRVVCVYEGAPSLTVIGARQILPGIAYPEIPVTEINIGLPIVREFPLNSLSDIEAASLALNPMENEGFVVLDQNFNRCKIKSPSYVAIHHLKEGFGARRIIRLIQLGEQSEVLSYFPEYRALFEEISAKIDAMIAGIEKDWAELMVIRDRKEFALEAVERPHPGVLFALFLNKAHSVREHILYSKKVAKKATAGSEEIMDFAFSVEKIEDMLGLKSAKPVEVAV